MKKSFFVIINRLNELRKNRFYRIGINFFFTLFFIFYVFYIIKKNYSTINDYSPELQWRFGLSAILIVFINYCLLAFSWHYLVLDRTKQISFKTNLENYALSQMANLLPTPIPFISSRLTLYKNVIGSKKIILYTIKEVEYHFFSGLFVISLIKIYFFHDLIWGLGVIPLLLSFFINFGFNQKDRPYIYIVRNRHSKSLLPIYGLNILTWLTAGIFFTSVIRFLNLPLLIDYPTIYFQWISASLLAYISAYTLGLSGFFREFSLNLMISNFYNASFSIIIVLSAKLLILIGILSSSLLILIIKFSFFQRGKI